MNSIKKLAHLRLVLEEIESATNNFAEENLIGQGGYGEVYKGQLLRSGKLINIAVRRLDRTHGQGDAEFLKEIWMLSGLNHENIVSLIGFCDQNGEKIIVNKHEVHESLDKYLSDPTLTWMQRLKISVGAAHALSYLHYDMGRNYSILHRNIKSSKILLDDNWEAKICGFNFSIVNITTRRHCFLHSNACGTLGYIDPVYMETEGVTDKSDVYSFGVVLFEVLCGRKVYTQDQHNRNLAQLAKLHFEDRKLDEMIDPNLRKQMEPQSLSIFSDTAYRCLKEERARRPDMDQILKRLENALEHQQEHHNNPVRSLSNQWKGKNLKHLRIPLKDIKLATKDFDVTNCIGKGGYGMVYKAKLNHFYNRNSPGKPGENKGELPKRRSPVAIKRIASRQDGLGEQGFWAEIEMLTSCKHRNIVSLLGFCDKGLEMILVYEHVSNGSLDDYLESINNNANLTWVQRLQICLDVAHGLNYLHTSMGDKERIIHRDIKSANILLDQNWEAKIADFGLSKIGPANQEDTHILTNVAGTDVYVDPEYVRTRILKKESDVYSFGVVLFEILSGTLAYDTILNVNNQGWLPARARRCFEQRKLHEIVDPKIKGETYGSIFTLIKGANQDSLDTFAKIAYQCLEETQAKRPTMEVVILELEKALNFQLNRMDVIKISPEDIILATENFSEKNFIGKGGFGDVYKGNVSHRDQRNTIAVKRNLPTYGQGKREFLAELEILLEYKHENVIGLVGYCDEMDNNIIVYEHAPRGSLDKYLNDASLTWMKRLRVCIDVASGLHFLHGGVGNQERIIHRDIKSSNILLDDDWKAKITDFGLSMMSPINLEMDYVIELVAGTMGYIDPEYVQMGILTDKSDVYSFGVVLSEILCGRLVFNVKSLRVTTAMTNTHGFLQSFVKQCYKEGNIDEIVFHDIKEQIGTKSLSTFLRIAYRCLHDRREKRPTMDVVVQQLQNALEFQEDYEIWEPKLPIDYKEIIEMSKSPKIYSTEKKKNLPGLLYNGILLQKDKVERWVTSRDKVTNEMISATSFLYNNFRSLKWRSIPNSRFSKVAKMLDISNLNIHIKMKTQFLSPGINYRVYLVFKFWDRKKVSNGPIYLNLKYQKASETFNAYFAEWKDDRWMTIELHRFTSHEKATEFEVLLERFSYNFCGSGAIFVEGIEFRAFDNVGLEESERVMDVEELMEPNSNLDWAQHLARDYEEIIKRSGSNMDSKEELYFQLTKGILIDKNEKYFWLRKEDGKKCHMLPSRAILYNSSNLKHFKWKPLAQSRFEEVGELLPNQVFLIKCDIETQMLSPNTTYACYLVYKLSEKCHGLEFPIKVRDLRPSKNKDLKIVYFRSPSPLNLHKNEYVPEQREDGWTEVKVWNFIFDNEHNGVNLPMDLKLISYEGKMFGLIVCGIEFRPI